jgi:ABC-type Fe3+/spermidine/putrescine transport system ATPase subunit
VFASENGIRIPPEERPIAMVFQSYALWPHMDVHDNIAFPLRRGIRRVPQEEAARRVGRVVELLRLKAELHRPVSTLSGGQQQRVALARALAPEPQVLLLDEPLSNLDPALRERTRRELRALIKRVGITSIFVTHEQEEAFDLGDRVAVLGAGRLEQLATADELYEHPASLFVATFVGRANVLRGNGARALGAAAGQVLVVRPERLLLADAGVPGVVRDRRYTGAAAFYVVETELGDRLEVLARPDAARVGDRVYLEATRVLTFPEEGE